MVKQGESVIWLFLKSILSTTESNDLVEGSQLIWLFLRLSLKMTTLRSSPVLPSYVKHTGKLLMCVIFVLVLNRGVLGI